MKTLPAPAVPISWGELLDKITILEIKMEQLCAESARDNVKREVLLLRAIAEPVLTDSLGEVRELMAQLKSLNGALWDIENKIRTKEAVSQFDAGFIELARSVYKLNDARGKLKHQINLALSSELIEEKVYSKY